MRVIPSRKSKPPFLKASNEGIGCTKTNTVVTESDKEPDTEQPVHRHLDVLYYFVAFVSSTNGITRLSAALL